MSGDVWGIDVDLSLVSVEEIMKELWKRYDTLVFMGRRNLGNENDEIDYKFKDQVGCLGLLRIADTKLKEGYGNSRPR